MSQQACTSSLGLSHQLKITDLPYQADPHQVFSFLEHEILYRNMNNHRRNMSDPKTVLKSFQVNFS
jgi:hypothetical protein